MCSRPPATAQAGALVIVGEAGIGKTSLLDAADATAGGFQRLHRAAWSRRTGWTTRDCCNCSLPCVTTSTPYRRRSAERSRRRWDGARRLPPTTGTSLPPGRCRCSLRRPKRLPCCSSWTTCTGSIPALRAPCCSRHDRLAHDAVAILLATRHGAPARHRDRRSRHDRATIGLSASDAAARCPAWHRSCAVVSRLVAATHGNPLALIEAAERLTPAQRRGAAQLPDQLPTGARLEAVYEPVIAAPSARRRDTLCSWPPRPATRQPSP